MSAAKNAPKEPLPAHTHQNLASEWDVPQDGAAGTAKTSRLQFGRGTVRWTIEDRLDRVFPPHKRILGRSRRTVLIAIGVVILALLALIIGLAAGLSSKKSNSRNLPLPDGAETYTGDLTYYEPGLGACGITSTAKQDIVSISHYTFDAVQKGSDPNQNPLCGRKIRTQRVYNGKTVSLDLTVVDRCVGCEPTDLDVSPAAFDKLADHDLGRVKTTWAWL